MLIAMGIMLVEIGQGSPRSVLEPGRGAGRAIPAPANAEVLGGG
jgi:hypothetical protein